MSAWWEYLEQEMQSIRENATSFGVPAISKGTVSMTPNNQSTSDITALSFFEVDFRFIINVKSGDNTFDVIHPGLYNYSNSIGYLNAVKAGPNVWVLADSLAKSTHSTILTDLGQTSFTPNILADPDTLQHFTSNFSVDSFRSHMKAGPAVQDYDTLKNTTGTLGVTPSVFSTNYLCQIPQLKSAGNLFVAVLLADLVFLQALWKIFTLLVGWLGLQNRSGTYECQGCIDQARRKRGTRWEAGVLSPEGPTTPLEQVELNVLDGAKAKIHHRRASSQHQPLLR